MKKVNAFIICFIALLSFTACSQTENNNAGMSENNNLTATSNYIEQTEETKSNSENIDIDLTKLSSTMIYSEVSNMMIYPDEYKGKRVKMRGMFNLYTDEATNKNYYACVIADATACCQQGLEFNPKDKYKYPDDFPAPYEEIEVIGEFQTYQEGELTYFHLVNADMTII